MSEIDLETNALADKSSFSIGSDVVKRMQDYYRANPGLVTSPFITREGFVDIKLFEKTMKQLSININNSPVLDLGCGTGLLSTYFTSHKIKYIGIDLNAHKNFNWLRAGHTHFAQASALEIPFKNNSIRTIVCLDSFEHYPDQYQAAREIYRVLRQDGSIFLSVPTYSNIAGWIKKRMEKSGKYKPDTWAPFDFWAPQELEHFMTPAYIHDIFASAGFKNFRTIGLARELCYGLLPWLWHPKCPAKLAALITRIFHLWEKPIVQLFPSLSLHTFWHISN